MLVAHFVFHSVLCSVLHDVRIAIAGGTPSQGAVAVPPAFKAVGGVNEVSGGRMQHDWK